MHKVFGIKKDEKYYDRVGAYFLPVCNGKVGVVRTPKGLFFIGGKIEDGESHIECIKRESFEEIGFLVRVTEMVCSGEAYTIHNKIGNFHPVQYYYRGELVEKIAEPLEMDHELIWMEYEQLKGKMFSAMQNWALDQIMNN